MKIVDFPCPECGTKSSVTYDDWEDCFLCHVCGHLFYPAEKNPDAGIWHIGDTREEIR